jgi:ribulose-5-phosphate 4-epimerase/fuculose-1-phosphate aldolase
MSELEGVTKYELHFNPSASLAPQRLTELNAWRALLHRLGLIGQDANRYGGVGFGNLSMRLDAGGARFAVTGTQTGHLPALEAQHYAIVTACDPEANRLTAEGPIAPSSESLTHGQIYALAPSVNFVFHVHAPRLWRAAAQLALPATDARAEYGTPDMVREVERLFRESAVHERGLFVMGGHEDGVVSFGATAEAAGAVLLRHLALAVRQDCGSAQ